MPGQALCPCRYSDSRGQGGSGPGVPIVPAVRSLVWPGLRLPRIRVEFGQAMTTVEQVPGIAPFHVEWQEEALADLRRRLAPTRWPSRELVEDHPGGVQLAEIQ